MTRFFRLGLVPLALAAAALRADDAAAPAQAAPTPTPTPATAAAAPASPTDDVATLRTDNKQLTDELAAAWKESDKLKADLAAAQAAASKSTAEAADLKTQLDAQKAQATVGATAAAASTDANPQLAEVQDKLATALRSFSVIQNENSDLKATVDKLTSENAALSQQAEAAKAQIATLQTQANATLQIVPLRNELRQSQDEVNQLARDNEILRNRIASLEPEPGTGPVPATSARQPTRPGTAEALGPEAVPTPTPTPAPAARTYVIAEGDTLSRIARRFYGSAGQWNKILSANRSVIKNENKLPVGETITIP